ncbi:MAG: hypothetical protein RLZZ352_1321 [Pseudomonadota bacterium]|jgi:hypothetical protein
MAPTDETRRLNRFALWFNNHPRWSVLMVWLLVAVLAGSSWWADTRLRTQQRVSLLETEALRSAVEIMATTLNGNLMGSITMLGIMDPDIKQDATNRLLSVGATIDSRLGMVGGAFDARGVFVVSRDGIVKTSWNSSGKPNTGLDVRFRPYYQMAMQGKSSVYAAVGTSSGERTLYFAAPVYPEAARSVVGVGAVVAQARINRLEALLRDKAHAAALLSPQGVVFAASRDEWVGLIDGTPSPERLKAIRDLKQFGKWFDTTDPKPLPVRAETGVQTLNGVRHAVAAAAVDWNDPAGPWTLVLLEDLSQTVPPASTAWRVAAVTAVAGLLAWMLLKLLRGRQQQLRATAQLQQLADEQNRQLTQRSQLAAAMLRLQQCNDLPTLARTFLSDAHAMHGVLHGVVYAHRVNTPPDHYALLASFACATPPPAHLVAGQGLLGQCALERQPRVLAAGAGSLPPIRSGLGMHAARSLVMLPLIRGDAVLGLLEVAAFSAPEQFPLEAFTELAHALALNLEILQRSEVTETMLAQTAALRQSAALPLQEGA